MTGWGRVCVQETQREMVIEWTTEAWMFDSVKITSCWVRWFYTGWAATLLYPLPGAWNTQNYAACLSRQDHCKSGQSVIRFWSSARYKFRSQALLKLTLALAVQRNHIRACQQSCPSTKTLSVWLVAFRGFILLGLMCTGAVLSAAAHSKCVCVCFDFCLQNEL